MGDFKKKNELKTERKHRKNEIREVVAEREQRETERSTVFTKKHSGRKNRTISCPIALWESFAEINKRRGLTNSGSLTMLIDEYVRANKDILNE